MSKYCPEQIRVGLIGHLLVVVLDVVEAEIMLLILAQCVIFFRPLLYFRRS